MAAWYWLNKRLTRRASKIRSVQDKRERLKVAREGIMIFCAENKVLAAVGWTGGPIGSEETCRSQADRVLVTSPGFRFSTRTLKKHS